MTDRSGDQKGAQQHAQGDHGEKTHAHLIEQLESGPSGEPPRDDTKHPLDGKHRLFEQREQHDEADLNSEKNRLSRDIEAHDHNRENFQVVGGAKDVRVESRNRVNPGEPDAPTPGPADAPRPTRVPGEGAS